MAGMKYHDLFIYRCNTQDHHTHYTVQLSIISISVSSTPKALSVHSGRARPQPRLRPQLGLNKRIPGSAQHLNAYGLVPKWLNQQHTQQHTINWIITLFHYSALGGTEYRPHLHAEHLIISTISLLFNNDTLKETTRDGTRERRRGIEYISYIRFDSRPRPFLEFHKIWRAAWCLVECFFVRAVAHRRQQTPCILPFLSHMVFGGVGGGSRPHVAHTHCGHMPQDLAFSYIGGVLIDRAFILDTKRRAEMMFCFRLSKV